MPVISVEDGRSSARTVATRTFAAGSAAADQIHADSTTDDDDASDYWHAASHGLVWLELALAPQASDVPGPIDVVTAIICWRKRAFANAIAAWAIACSLCAR